MSGYKTLIVWQKSMGLVIKIYELTADFPDSEKFGLVSQVRRSAISIPSNLAEGSRRKQGLEKNNFLRIAFGSAAELETQLEISKRLSFGNKNKYSEIENLLIEILKMLNKITKY